MFFWVLGDLWLQKTSNCNILQKYAVSAVPYLVNMTIYNMTEAEKLDRS